MAKNVWPQFERMGEDATLDAFIGAEDGTDREDSEPADTRDTACRPEPETVEPATTTFAFAPSGASCERCGDTVEKRWGQDGALVCVDCKEW
ncbi:MAG: DUF7573 domain-containing protein [archaeon]